MRSDILRFCVSSHPVLDNNTYNSKKTKNQQMNNILTQLKLNHIKIFSKIDENKINPIKLNKHN
jgi:hypothetical protein